MNITKQEYNSTEPISAKYSRMRTRLPIVRKKARQIVKIWFQSQSNNIF